jgi:hypothetical protein
MNGGPARAIASVGVLCASAGLVVALGYVGYAATGEVPRSLLHIAGVMMVVQIIGIVVARLFATFAGEHTWAGLIRISAPTRRRIDRTYRVARGVVIVAVGLFVVLVQFMGWRPGGPVVGLLIHGAVSVGLALMSLAVGSYSLFAVPMRRAEG